MKVIVILGNIFVPGVGSLFAGKVGQGIIQLIMAIVGIAMTFTVLLLFFGVIIWGIAFVWGMVTAFKYAFPPVREAPKSGIGR